jgi:hypothetical protein
MGPAIGMSSLIQRLGVRPPVGAGRVELEPAARLCGNARERSILLPKGPGMGCSDESREKVKSRFRRPMKQSDVHETW